GHGRRPDRRRWLWTFPAARMGHGRRHPRTAARLAGAGAVLALKPRPLHSDTNRYPRLPVRTPRLDRVRRNGSKRSAAMFQNALASPAVSRVPVGAGPADPHQGAAPALESLLLRW